MTLWVSTEQLASPPFSIFTTVTVLQTTVTTTLLSTVPKQPKSAHTALMQPTQQLSYDGVFQRLQSRHHCCKVVHSIASQGNGQDSCEECSQSWYALFCLSGVSYPLNLNLNLKSKLVCLVLSEWRNHRLWPTHPIDNFTLNHTAVCSTFSFSSLLYK